MRTSLALTLAPAVLLVACEGGLAPRPPLEGSDADVGSARDSGIAAPIDAGGGSDAALDPARDAGPGDRDAGPPDAATPDAGPPPPSGPVLYPADRRHSPITADLAEDLRAAARRGPSLADDVFMKVGDSITVSTQFLHCFAGSHVELDGRPLDPTLARFRAGSAGGSSPFTRVSQAAVVGWSANAALAGSPSPLEQERSALSPRFAVVMFGTNDVGYRDLDAYAQDIWTIAGSLLDRGTIPILSSIPPRDDSASADARVPRFNLAVRAIAQGLGVPFVDLHRELLPLPSHGLGGDGVHPNVYGSGACVLDAAGLRYGYNVRNLLTLEALDRAVRALDGEALDADAPRLSGSGAPSDPFVIEGRTFVAMSDTAGSPHRALDRYGCAPGTDESGPEEVYRLELASPARITATVVSARGVDVDVHLLRGAVRADACVARDHKEVSADVEAGTWYVVVDSWVDGAGAAASGPYLLLVTLG